MEMTKYEPGTFCWWELLTSDQDGAKRFYSSMFGWEPKDSPIGPGMTYTMFFLGGRDVGATFRMTPDMKGIPPHWGSYVSVADVDDAAARAEKLGGKIMKAPFDVMTFGRMATVADPQGAFFNLWQPKEHAGAGRKQETHAVGWNELWTSDPKGAIAFYTGLFGWTAKTHGPSEYTELFQGDKAIGGMMKLQMPDVPPHWAIYIEVKDCDAAIAKAKSLGAALHFGPMDVPHVGKFAALADPQGAGLMVIQLTEKKH